ncbi:MAG: YeiH family protein, partial [Roseimicrobium sp.]
MTAPARTPWWQNEDWLALLAAVPLMGAVAIGWKPALPVLAWKSAADLGTVFSSTNLTAILGTTGILVLVSAVALAASLGKRVLSFLAGASVVFAMAWAAQWLAGNASIKACGLEYVIFALALGLLWSQLLPVPQWLSSAVRTEFFIKTGIVILGAGMLFGDLLKAGVPGLIQALLVIPVVWHITFRLARWLKVDDEFGVMLSTAVSICGVSAAIAACGAIQGDKKKLSYVTSVVLLCAVPMMIVMPWAVRWLGLSEAVGGAWLGGTLDTSGSVLAATEMVGDIATKTGTVVKLSQNVLIGFAAFFISLWWAVRERRTQGDAAARVSFAVIWERFPKFVLGFIGASLIF